MGCNCTANLRVDIIKRFFANQFNGKEFALELIRIVECQQTVMSRELEDWFKVWFRFPQDMLEEFLACVMKRQQTMSDRLQKVIRARFFPTDQRMADDFIRVVLCGCCPQICGTDVAILGLSDGFTVDGWYLQVDASNLVYMESDVITETVACESGLANYILVSGSVIAAPHIWQDGSWQRAMYVELISQNVGVDFTLSVLIEDYFANPVTGVAQISEDGGVTYTPVGTLTDTDLTTGAEVTFLTTATSYIYQVVVTDTVTGCQFYNPAPTQSSSSYCIDYAVIDGGIGFNVLGTINGVNPPEQATVVATMGEPYQGVTGAYGGVYLLGGGDTFYVQVARPSTSPVTASLATVLDALGNSVPAPTQNTACELHRQIAQFTFVDADLTGIQNFTINGVNMISPDTFAINRAELADNIKTGLQSGYGFFDPNMSIYIYQLGNECFVVIDSLYDFQDLFWQDTLGNSGTATFILQ